MVIEKKEKNVTLKSESDLITSDVVPNDQLTLYLVIGGILVGVVLVLVVCCSVVGCIQKRKARDGLTSSNMAIHEKYLDTSRHISSLNLTSSGSRSGQPQHHGSYRTTYTDLDDDEPSRSRSKLDRPPTRSQSHGAINQSNHARASMVSETSFTSPHRLSQMLYSSSTNHVHDPGRNAGFRANSSSYVTEESPGLSHGGQLVSKNPGVVTSSNFVPVSVNSIGDGSMDTSFNPNLSQEDSSGRVSNFVDEYADEPSRTTWKRRRKRDETV